MKNILHPNVKVSSLTLNRYLKLTVQRNLLSLDSLNEPLFPFMKLLDTKRKKRKKKLSCNEASLNVISARASSLRHTSYVIIGLAGEEGVEKPSVRCP